MKKLSIALVFFMAIGCSTQKIAIVQKSPDKEMQESKVLYFVNDKEISESQLKAITPDDIESVEVIKDQAKVSKYTKDKIDGVVIITLKKGKKVVK